MRKTVLYDLFFTPGAHIGTDRESGAWVPVRLPHDMLAHAPYAPDGERSGSAQGYIDPCCDGTYRTAFTQDAKDTAVYLYADGVYRDSVVYLNGREAGRMPHGFRPYTFDISALVTAGENTLEIYVDNRSERTERWYSGAGILRVLTLLSTPGEHVLPDGARFTTISATADQAVVRVDAEVTGGDLLTCQVLDGDEQVVSDTSVPVGNGRVSFEITIPAPRLWSADTPALYCAALSVLNADGVWDTQLFRFGIRTVEWVPERGLFVNGNAVKLYGVNLHHDLGAAGAAFYPDLWRERLERLKALGCNAVRTSHNPQAAQFYDLCDELGLYCIDELYDKWDSGAYDAHFQSQYAHDIRAWMRRDYNHPCVLVWSVGNELPDQGYPSFDETLDKLVAAVKSFDPVRPVTFAMHPYAWPKALAAKTSAEKAAITAQIAKHVDLLLCNYQELWYAQYHAESPSSLIIGGETYHWYTGEAENFHTLAPVHPLAYVRDLDYCVGAFYWAGISYRGESRARPSRGWIPSQLDITGEEKVQAKSASVFWRAEPQVWLAAVDSAATTEYEPASWAFPPCVRHLNLNRPVGSILQLWVFSNCDRITLFAGGMEIGSADVDKRRNACFYEIEDKHFSSVTAVGYIGGQEVCRDTLFAHGNAAHLAVSVYNAALSGAGDSACAVRAALCDADGRVCETERQTVHFQLPPTLSLIATDNGDPFSWHDPGVPVIAAHRGRCVAYLRADRPCIVIAEAVGTNTVRLRTEEAQ